MRIQFYNKDKIDKNHLLFDNHALWVLLIPVMVEQLLNTFMGMADTMMVSRVGSEAISAVSLVDSVNVLFIQIFAALAAGATILCSFYIGQKDRRRANETASQVLFALVTISLIVMALCLFFRKPLLRIIFGQVDAGVMVNSQIYFFITALSFPFIATSNAGGAFYRSGGESRFPMTVSVICNLLNIGGNAILIFGLGLGVMGAALSTLISRVVNALVLMIFLRRDAQPIVIRNYLIRPEFGIIRRVLNVGIPSGIENGMFQFGKLAIQSSISTLGTTAIAAQAMTSILEGFNGIAAMGIGIGMMTVVGQCIGAGRKEEARYNIVKLTMWSEIVIIIGCAVVMLLTKPVTILAGMESEAARMCISMMTFVTCTKPIFWVPSFIPPYGMRAAGDVKFSMIVSTITMWSVRVLTAVILIRVFHFGAIACWIGMAADWAVRGVIFSIRFFSGRWLEKSVAG